MKGVLLGLALTTAMIVPASAEGITVASGFGSMSGFGASHFRGVRLHEAGGSGHHGGFDGGHSRHVRVGDGFGGGWGYYDGDYDANRSFAEDKWNDWWHDRPDRAYPAWMRRNQDCSRPWYSGSELTC